MKWAYGITTVPSRRENLFERTLQSLAVAGFDNPRLFVDGVDDAEGPVVDALGVLGLRGVNSRHDPTAVAPGGATAVVDFETGFGKHEGVAHAVGDLDDGAVAILPEHVAFGAQFAPDVATQHFLVFGDEVVIRLGAGVHVARAIDDIGWKDRIPVVGGATTPRRILTSP